MSQSTFNSSNKSSPEMEALHKGRPKRNAAKTVAYSPPMKTKSVTPVRPKSATPSKVKTVTPVAKTKSKVGSGSNSTNNSPILTPNRYSTLAGLTEEKEEIPDKETMQCAKCKKSSEESAKLLECNRCKAHYCICCLGKTVKEYDILDSSDCMWFCYHCREKVERNLVVDRDIETKCKEIMMKFGDRVATLETALTDKCSKVEVQEMLVDKCSKAEAKQIVNETLDTRLETAIAEKVQEKCSKEEAKQLIEEALERRLQPENTGTEKEKCSKEEAKQLINEALEMRLRSEEKDTAAGTVEERPTEDRVHEVLTEINERKSRENNIVIYGLDEITSKSYEERLAADHAKIQTVMNVLDVELPKTDIDRIIRLGRYHKDKKRRPLLVAMKADDKKAAIFNGAKNLKENAATTEVRIANDQTRAEREHDKKLYDEARELEKNSGEFKYKVRGPPWARRIIRFREKTPAEEKTREKTPAEEETREETLEEETTREETREVEKD